jgi:hypothetical protein
MAQASADIGKTNYAASITAGHHLLSADESVGLSGKDNCSALFELLCATLCACTSITLRMYAERKQSVSAASSSGCDKTAIANNLRKPAQELWCSCSYTLACCK